MQLFASAMKIGKILALTDLSEAARPRLTQ